MVGRIRSRSEVENYDLGWSYYYPTGKYTFYSTNPSYSEEMIDFTHKGPPYKTGGPMTLRRHRYEYTPSSPYTAQYGFYYAGGIRFVPNTFCGASGTPHAENSNLSSVSVPDVTGLGAQFWDTHKPGKSGGDLGQMLGELNRIPTIPGKQILKVRDAVGFLRALGSEYLNAEFGWKPLLKDIQDIHKNTKRLHDYLYQLRRDNGKGVRRRGHIPVTSNVTYSNSYSGGEYMYPLPPSAFQVTFSGKADVQVRETAEAWFSAKFRYYIHKPDSWRWQAKAIAALYGVNPTPALIWELTPWSWLVDWHTNVGHILSNMTNGAVDELVADYAYVMKHTGWRYYINAERKLKNPSGSGPHVTRSAQAVRFRESKVRRTASPFGFGIDSASYSDKQKLILGALGLSRLPQ
jgi:hypothetical protein